MGRTAILAIALALALAACGKKAPAPSTTRDAATPSPPPTDAAAADAVATGPIDLHPLTAAVGLADDAACLVVRFPDGTIRQSDAARCAVQLRPASTFKLPNTLIGAEVGLIDSPDTILTYDPKRYPPAEVRIPDWRQDQTVRKALEISAVPLYRLLAVKIGAARMQTHLDAIGYGNRSIAGGLDKFWLSGGLAISATEQLDFLTRLVAGTLPVSARAQDILRAAMPVEKVGDATLYWKTGTGDLDDGRWVGWLVGWIDRPGGAHVYACWIQEQAADVDRVRAHRTAVCRGALAALGLFPAPTP